MIKRKETLLRRIKESPYFDSEIFYNVPDEMIDEEVMSLWMERAIIENMRGRMPHALYDKKHLFTPDICNLIAEKTPWLFYHIPKEKKTYKLYMTLVKNDGFYLHAVPEKYRTLSICREALKSEPRVLRKEVPRKHWKKVVTTELIKEIAKINLFDVPEEYRTSEVCKIALLSKCESHAGWQRKLNIESLPKKYQNKRYYRLAVETDGLYLFHIPEEKIDLELSQIAVRNNPEAIRGVPNKILVKLVNEAA